MSKIPTVPTSQELLDIAFGRAAKVTSTDKKPFFRKKKVALKKMQVIPDVISAKIDWVVGSFPTFESLDPFRAEIMDIQFSRDIIKMSLGRLGGLKKPIKRICNSVSKKIKYAKDPEEIDSMVHSVYGRISSIVGMMDGVLDFLSEVRRILNNTPSIDFNTFTAVVAGCPNVGKSALVGALSTAAPEVAHYPFTTHDVTLGHVLRKGKWSEDKIQLVDTPGILDRPPEKHNTYEKAALNALRNLAHEIIFIMDASEYCGYPIEKQRALLKIVKNSFENIPFIFVLSKVDIEDEGFQDFLKKALNDEEIHWIPVSTSTGQGTRELVDILYEHRKGFLKELDDRDPKPPI